MSDSLYDVASSYPRVDHEEMGSGADADASVVTALGLVRESEKQLRLALEAAEIGTFVCWIPERRYEFDRQMLSLLGLPLRPTFSHDEVARLIHPDDRTSFDLAFESAIDDEGLGMFGEEIRVVRSDGSIRWLSMTGQTTFGGSRTWRTPSTYRAIQISGVATDITEHKQRASRLSSDLRDMQLLRDLSARLVSEYDTEAFFDAIVVAAVSIARATGGCLHLVDNETNGLKLQTCFGLHAVTDRGCVWDNCASSTSCVRAPEIGVPAVVRIGASACPDPDASLREMAGTWSAQSMPLVTRAGRTVGILSTNWSEPDRKLSEREKRFTGLLARQAAEMIERRRSKRALHESERRSRRELVDTQLLQRLSAQLLEGQGTALLYETLVDAAKSIMHSAFASMQMVCHDHGRQGELRLIASRGFGEQTRRQWEWVRANDHTVCAQALRTGHRVIVDDITRCDFMAGTIDQARLLEAGIRAVQTTPLVSREGTILGMISTHWASPHRPSERDLRLLDILARQAADLIERTQAEEALRWSESQLKEADRRKDEFLATLAHELRNPLAPLRTSLELIRLSDNTRESVEEVREMMEEQLALLVRLVDDLLDVSRITSGKIRLQRRPTELAAVVATAVQANRAAIDQGQIHLSLDMPETRVMLDSDPVRFAQVVSNVLNNALKFTDPGGRISISAELTSPDTNPREVVLRIADSGVGISSDMLPRVFDLFTQDEATAYRSQTGLGIGLALARHLIQMHGGTIEAHSAGAGQGSTFTLRMPAAPLLSSVPAGSPPAPAICGGRHVLVVDDNTAAAKAMQRLVTALGGECRVAHNGEAGLASVREFRPDIVILDIGMPGLDGYQTCRRIRDEFGSNIVVVALTGWGQERDKLKAMEAGFDMHLTKPADPIVLEGLLANAGRR